MRKRERAQVVELLRCAADHSPDPHRTAPTDQYGFRFNGLLNVWPAEENETAVAAQAAVMETYEQPGDWHRALLEAALRVEQGEWP